MRIVGLVYLVLPKLQQISLGESQTSYLFVDIIHLPFHCCREVKCFHDFACIVSTPGFSYPRILDLKNSQLKCVHTEKPALLGYELNNQDSLKKEEDWGD